MLPLGDSSRCPIHFPFMTLVIIAANVVMFIFELTYGDAFINRWSMVPANITAGKDLITLISAMFLHSGWLHILGNMLFFWVFGPEIEDVMGSITYLIFYLIGGLVASFAQIVVAPHSTIPNLGASGAIAAIMGAFLITYPRDKIRTIIILGWWIQIAFLPAILMVGLWFVLQVLSELGALSLVQNGGSGGVAYMAHIGGFVFGMIFCRLFESRRRRERQGLT